MSDFHPKVSLVIPVYNGADYVDEAIRSALAQTYCNIEIIVVNDGSRDDGATAAIARTYGDAIRYIERENGGVAAALNTAVDAMTGDYMSWLSHDDLYAPQKVQRNVDALRALKADERANSIVYSDYAVFSDSPTNATAVRMDGVSPRAFRFWLTMKNALHGCTLLVPRRAFEELGTFDEGLRTTQDFDLWFRFARRFDFRHMAEVLVYARSHADQGSVRMAGTAYEEGNALLLRFVAALTDQDITAGGYQSRLQAYTALTRTFWQRGFIPAARATNSAAVAARREAPLPVQIASVAQLVIAPLEMWFWKTVRRSLSPQRRARLRSLSRVLTAKRDWSHLETRDLKQRFSKIYKENIFGGSVSRSGEGSDLVQTEIIRREIPRLLHDLGACSFLDAPCGDWHWMQRTDLGVSEYIGVDVVEDMIELNRRQFGNEHVRFACLDLTKNDLPKVDVIFSRDCLVHLSSTDALKIIENFKRSGSRYLLTTTFSNRAKNKELEGNHAFWRPLNMQAAPFNFPDPIRLINEGCTEERGKYRDKCLGLWKLDDIVISPVGDGGAPP